MKRILYVFLAMLTFWSCSDEKLDCTDCASQNGRLSTVKLTMRFPGRTIAPKTYAGTYAADAVEKSIDNVRIFVFNDDGAGQPKTLLISEAVTVTAGDTEAGVKATFFMRKFGELHLVAVANIDFDQDDIQKMLGESFDEFSKTIVRQPAGVANKFAMCSDIVSAKIPDPQTTATAPSLSFLLERLSARIDIKNETTTAGGGKFVLEGARLVNAIDRSFLIKGQSPALKIGNIEYGALAISMNTWITNSGVSGDMSKMYMELYAYENVANTLVVQVKGTYKGLPAQFDLPFGAKEVKRNTRYVIKIQNVNNNKAAFTVTNKDWEEGGNISLKPDLDGSAPTITKIEASDASGNPLTTAAHALAYAGANTPNNANLITLNSADIYYTKITVESPQTEATLLVNKAEVPWVSVKELSKANISSGKLVQTFLVAYAGSQDLYERTAELEVQNKFSPDKINRHLIKVTQPQATTTTNHLARFANANVGDLNQFADVITPDNLTDYDKLGKYYQWGRNVAFTYGTTVGTTVGTTATKSNGNDALLWSNRFIASTARPFTWTKTSLGDDWGKVVAKATSAPSSYKGNNGGDPCPKGYRLPKKEEAKGIFPYADAANINFNGRVSKKNVVEKITIKGVSADYTADYYSTTPNVIYALKMKDAKNANLTAYRYEYKGAKGLWVTSRLLGTAGATVTVEQVANEDFWNDATKGGSDVIRYFPAMGLLTRTNALSRDRGNSGYGWVAESLNSSNAWYFGFSNASMNIFGNEGMTNAFSLRPIKKLK